MSHNRNQNDIPERLVDLLIQSATSGISATEQQELDQLAAPFDNQKELERFELAASACDLAMGSNEVEEMPAGIRDQLLVSAGRFFAADSEETASPFEMDAELDLSNSKVELAPRRTKGPAGPNWREMIALAVTAASLLLLLTGYNPFAKPDVDPVAISTPQLMNDFVASPPTDLVDVAWQPVHNKTAGGKVLWSDAKQEGYMVFSGMKVNDPTVEQYQLWIFDTDPGQAAPVEGGVFDITASDIDSDGNVTIPIKPHVHVDRAVQFAVTVEKPGGVYVSKRVNIPVLAKIASID